MSTEPKSIRLNKTHRDDMLNAVMQQWGKTNPVPTGSTNIEVFEAIMTRLVTPKKGDPAELKALKHLMTKTTEVNSVLTSLSPALKDDISFPHEYDFRIWKTLDDGTRGGCINSKLPKALADKLKIPYVHVKTIPIYDTEYGSYAQKHETGQSFVEIVAFANSNSYNILNIPSDFPAIRDHSKMERLRNLWENDKAKVREEIADYLNQFNTTGQIRDQWPEMVDYLPAHIADPSRVINLPALTRSRLNERLGIQ